MPDPDEISGQVTEGGVPVEDAVVAALRQEDAVDLSQAQATEIEALAKLTDANGEYIFEQEELFGDAQNYHVVAHKDAGNQRRGQQNYPYVEGVGTSIPDSAIYHYPFAERTDTTLVENIQNADGTANGISNVSGDWVDGYAESGDGVDDHGLLPVNQFGSEMGGPHSILFSFDSTDDGRLMGGRLIDGGMTLYVVIGDYTGETGVIGWQYRDDTDSGRPDIYTDARFDDGNKHRVALVQRGTDESTMEIWVDGVEEPTTVRGTGSVTSVTDFTYSLSTHGWNNEGSISDNIEAAIDNPIFCQTDLSQSEIESDYQSQPWQ